MLGKIKAQITRLYQKLEILGTQQEERQTKTERKEVCCCTPVFRLGNAMSLHTLSLRSAVELK